MLTEEQLALRLTGVTATDAPAIAGYHPFSTAPGVWLQKMGYATVDPSPDLERGTFDEPGLARWYTHRTGGQLTFPGTLRHPKHDIVLATPDAIVDGTKLLEIKSPRWSTGYQWGRPGTDEVPAHIRMQVMWQMAVTGMKTCDVAARLFDDLAIFHVDFSQRLFDLLLDVARDFWTNHVLARVEPAADGSPGYKKLLELTLPNERAEVEEDNADAMHALVAEHASLDASYRAANLAREKVRQQIMRRIGTRGGLRGEYGVVYYRDNKPSEKTDWKAVAKELGASDELVNQHTTTKPGARPLKLFLAKDTK